MYQIEWFDEAAFKKKGTNHNVSFQSQIDIATIEFVLLTHWEEHCLECAPPTCYATCSLYMARKDKKCRNLFYGINRNHAFSGLYEYGAELQYRKWGKLETEVHNHYDTVQQLRITGRKNEKTVRLVDAIYGPLSVVDGKRKLNGALTVYRRKTLAEAPTVKMDGQFDDFLIECYSYQKEAFRLIIENKLSDTFRTSVVIAPGQNVVRIPFANFRYADGVPSGTLAVYPENDLEAHVAFTWLDFVRYKKRPDSKPAKQGLAPAAKVKCVAWDLDNTLWKGVFVESEPDSLVLNEDALSLIKKFDEMGILQTIVSKNSEVEILPFLKAHGIDEYFLYPAINWGQKSESLKNIAESLNINIDTFAVIDDSPFERSEIAAALPQVRIYDELSITNLLSLPEFDTPITDEGRKRRKFYMVDQQRSKISERFSGDYKGFLKSCDFHLNIFVPDTKEKLLRCYELIQRTNQLNISSKRYTRAEFDDIIASATYLKYAFDCRDRYGEYGIIGFCIIALEAGQYRITDFVISCRVAQKMVEQSFVYWLADKMKERKIMKLYADYTRTTRNSPLLAVFEDLKFEQTAAGGDKYILFKNVQTLDEQDKIITVNES